MEKEGKIMSEEKKELKDEEIKKTKELSSEELDKVSGGANNTSEYDAWQKDLASSPNPNNYGSTFEEWQQLQPVRKEYTLYGMLRCDKCGSWRTRPFGGAVWAGFWLCDDCDNGPAHQYYLTKSIYYHK